MFPFAKSVAASLMIATAAAAAPEGPKLPPGDERWLRVRSENFTLYSAVGEAETTALARELEMLRALLRKSVAGAAAGSGKPVAVYIFRSAKRFDEYAGDVLGDSKDVAGFHVTAVDRNIFAINSGAPASPRSTVFQRYAREFFGTTSRNLPLWLSAGLAEVYKTFRVVGGKAEIGRPDPETLRLARQGAMIPLPVLLAADTTLPLASGEGKQGKFHAQSWALVHMLLLGNAERRTQFAHYLTLLDRGDAPGAALEAAFGADTEGLSTELAAYVRRESLPLSVVETGDIPSARVDAPAPLDRADTLTHLGALLARTKDDPAPAEAHFRAALQADPARPLAEAGLASLLLKRKRYDEAVALYDRALARDPREPSTNLLAAMALLDRFAANDRPDRDASVLPPEIARARAMLGVALEFRPDDPFVLGAYGTTWVYDPGDLAPGIRALEKAVALAPPNRAVLFNLVQLHAAAGDAAKARAVIDGPLARVAEGDDLARARDSLVQIDVRAAEDAVEAGDLGKAIALLEQVRERTSDARTRTRAEARLATLRSAAVRKAEIDRFNEAAELFNARTYDRARTILDALVRDAQNEDIRGRAKELLTRIP